jgi:hypothetical protein
VLFQAANGKLSFPSTQQTWFYNQSILGSPRWNKLQHTTPIQKKRTHISIIAIFLHLTQWCTLHEYQHTVTAHVLMSIIHLLPHNLGCNNFHHERRFTLWLSTIIHKTRTLWTHEEILTSYPIILAIVLITLIFQVLIV